MLNIIVFILVLALALNEIHACHSPLHGVLPFGRKKRSTNDGEYPGHNESALVEYFTNCMTNLRSETFDWYSSTEWTIKDSNWYYYTDNSDCADEGFENETNCWISNVVNMFDESLSPTVKECIKQFAFDNGFPVNYSYDSGRKKRANPSRTLEIAGSQTKRNPGCPKLSNNYDKELEISSNIARLSHTPLFSIDNVAKFVDLYTVCTECKRYSGTGPTKCFANRFNQLTKFKSPIKESLQVASALYANGGDTVGNCINNVYMTQWFDKKLTTDGDDQSLAALQAEYPDAICKSPEGIQAILKKNGDPYGKGGNVLTISPKQGLVCLESDQKLNDCQDYQVRFCCKDFVGTCPLSNGWTSYLSDLTPNAKMEIETLDLIKQNNQGKVCSNPTGVSARSSSGLLIKLTDENVNLSMKKLTCVPSKLKRHTCEEYKLKFCCPSEIGNCPEGYSWTSWYSGSKSNGFDGTVQHLKETRNWQCKSESKAINLQLADSKRPYVEGGNTFQTLSPEEGALCLDEQQDEEHPCMHYRISFCCKQ